MGIALKDVDRVSVIVDADACPRSVMAILRRLRNARGFRLVTVASFNHQIGGDPAVDEHVVTGAEPQATDLAIVNRVRPGDVVITQDWGLAGLALARGAKALSPMGRVFDPRFIAFLEEERAVKAKVRRAGGRVKGPAARRREDDVRFEEALGRLLGCPGRRAPGC